MISEWILYSRVSFRSRSASQRWISSLSHARSLLQLVMRFSFTAFCFTLSCIHRPRFDRNLICIRSILKKTFKKSSFFEKWKICIKNQNEFLHVFEFDIVVFRIWFLHFCHLDFNHKSERGVFFTLATRRRTFLARLSPFHFYEPNFALTRLGFFASRSAKIVFSYF